MNQIMTYMETMLIVMLITLPIVLLYRYIKYKKRNSYCIQHEVGVILFIAYLLGLASLTIIPGIASDGIQPFEGQINLELFKVFQQTIYIVQTSGNWNYFTINFIGNIVMFMPIGFFIGLLFNKNSLIITTLYGLLFSLVIEISQLFISRGSDVDDLWLNTLGAILGYICYLFFKKIKPVLCESCKEKK